MRKLSSFLILLVGLFSFQLTFAQSITPNGTGATIQQLTSEWIADNQVPGVAVAVYYNGQDHFYNAGYANEDTQQPVTKNTIFELASLGKTLTATLLGICVEQNKCSLNDHAIKFLPQLKNNKNIPFSQVTLQELATHTSSLPRTYQELGVEDAQAPNAYNLLMQQLAAWQPDNTIGSQYLYSNIGFAILGQCVSNALGVNYQNAYQKYIFGPLNMTSSYVNVPADQFNRFAQGYNKKGNPAEHYPPSPWPGGGSISSDSSDMLQFGKAIIGAGNANAQLFSAMNITLQTYQPIAQNVLQALAWEKVTKNGLVFYRKNGMNKGFNTFVILVPQQKIAIVVLANKRGSRPGRLAHEILNVLV